MGETESESLGDGRNNSDRWRVFSSWRLEIIFKSRATTRSVITHIFSMGALYRPGFRTSLSYNHHQACVFMCVVEAHLCNCTFLFPVERNANANLRQKTEKTPMEGLEMERISYRTWFQCFAVRLSGS